METDNSSPSSDLELAREIALKLRPAAEPAPPPPEAESDPDYIDFALPKSPPPAPPPVPQTAPPTAVAAEVPVPPPDLGMDESVGFGTENWYRLLDWCLDVVGAETAFMVDSQGLSIAARGELPAEELEAVGNRLIIAFEQAHRMDARCDAESMVIQFGDQLLSGIAVRDGETQVVTIGILGPQPASIGVCRAIAEIVGRMIGLDSTAPVDGPEPSGA